jgi:hypothetical protein
MEHDDPQFCVLRPGKHYSSRKVERMVRRIPMSGCLALVLVSTGQAQPSPAIQNGGFESPAPRPGGYTLLTTGTAFPGWRVVGASGNVATVSALYASRGIAFRSRGGNAWLDLTGLANRAVGVEQTVETVAGRTYRLSFHVGNVIDGGMYGTTSTVVVLVDGQSVKHATNNLGDRGVQTWMRFQLDFRAKTARTRIAFINGDIPADNSNGLDDVSMSVSSASASADSSAVTAQTAPAAGENHCPADMVALSCTYDVMRLMDARHRQRLNIKTGPQVAQLCGCTFTLCSGMIGIGARGNPFPYPRPAACTDKSRYPAGAGALFVNPSACYPSPPAQQTVLCPMKR